MSDREQKDGASIFDIIMWCVLGYFLIKVAVVDAIETYRTLQTVEAPSDKDE